MASRLVDSDFDDSSDEEKGLAFTADNDFEGGQWIDGEFYYKSSKRKGNRRQTKEEAIYGIFAEDSSDEERSRKRSRPGGFGGKKKFSVYKPLSFVSGGVATQDDFEKTMSGVPEEQYETDTKAEDGQVEDSEDDEEPPRPSFANLDSLPQQDKQPQNARDETEGGTDDIEKDTDTKDKFKQLLKEGLGGASGDQATFLNNSDFRSFLSRATPPSEEQNEEQDSSDLSGQAPAQPKKPLPADFKGQLGKWEKHTKGFGMKMLEKFGFRGRLGKDEGGIVKPVEVKVRPAALGLGYGGFKEATELKANKELAADYWGTGEGKDDGGAEAEKPKKGQAKLDEQGWRKSAKPKKPKKVYKTVEEIMQDQPDFTAPPAQQQKIVDMRGPQIKVLADLQSLQEPANVGSMKPKLGEEMLHNIRTLVDLTEVSLFTTNRQIRNNEADLQAMQQEVKLVRNQSEAKRGKLERIQEVVEIIRRLKTGLDATKKDKVSAAAIRNVFKVLKSRYAEEYQSFHLVELASLLAFPALKNLLAAWNPLESPATVATYLEGWRDLFASPGRERAEILLSYDEEADDGDKLYYYEQLVEKVVMPRIRTAIVNEWDVKNPGACLVLISELRLYLPKAYFQTVLRQLISPKLMMAVEQWDPRTDPVHVHTWLLPWFPLMESQLKALFPKVRFTLKSVIKDWHPSYPTAHEVLLPWKDVWDKQSMTLFLESSIVPKLVALLREYVINPAEQDLKPFEWVMTWEDLLPPALLLSLLEGEFFPKWHYVLYLWLSNEGDYAEVWQWYSGWKEQFPESLKADPAIDRQFKIALKMMNDVLSNGSVEEPSTTGLTYESVLARRRKAFLDQQPENPKPESSWRTLQAAPATKKIPVSSQQVTLKEIVENHAAQNNITFLPTEKRTVNGKPIFRFGNILCYMDQDVLYAEMTPKNFSPLSLDELSARINR